jgi:hypothetical protein
MFLQQPFSFLTQLNLSAQTIFLGNSQSWPKPLRLSAQTGLAETSPTSRHRVATAAPGYATVPFVAVGCSLVLG